jgi:hypothetical protein
MQFSFKSDKSNGCFIWRLFHVHDDISLHFSQSEKCLNKSCRENQNTRSIIFFLKACLYENFEKYGRTTEGWDDCVIRRMRFVCWITQIHSEYVIFIALPREEWLRERASVLSYTYIICLVYPDYWDFIQNTKQGNLQKRTCISLIIRAL